MLFHVTADTTWSNLPLSGLFVDMLRRVVAEAGVAGRRPTAREKPAERGATRPPWRTLDGFGALGVAAAAGRSRSRDDFAGAGDAAHPPGFYGAAGRARAPSTRWPPGRRSRAPTTAPLTVRDGALDGRAADRSARPGCCSPRCSAS